MLIALLLVLHAFAGVKFINKDTLQVVAHGRSKKSGSQMRDQANCKEAARNEAMRLAIEALVDKNWPNVQGKVTKEQYGQKITQLTEGSIKGGHVISSQIDSSGSEVKCTVTFRVERFDPEAVHLRALNELGVNGIQIASARGDQHTKGGEVFRSEKLGPVSLGDTESQIVSRLGQPQTKANASSAAGEGQIWSYARLGIELKMVKQAGVPVVQAITAGKPCRFATKKGIKIGSTLAQLKKAYVSDTWNRNETTADRIVIGSNERGLVFQLRESKVEQIFLGAR